MEIIINKKLKLRTVCLEDAEDIFEYATDSETGPKAGWQPHQNIEQTKELIKGWLSPNARDEIFVVVYENKVVGTIGITDLNKNEKDEKNNYVHKLIMQKISVYEIGITISRKFWNMGIATFAIKTMIKYIFEVKNAEMIVMLHYKENLASEKIQIKNNFIEVASYDREKPWWITDCKTMIVRQLTKKDWEKQYESN